MLNCELQLHLITGLIRFSRECRYCVDCQRCTLQNTQRLSENTLLEGIWVLQNLRHYTISQATF